VPTELSRREFSWVLGGPQGGGINASAEIYAKALSHGGLHVFANIEFHSNIMGKHSYYRVTAAPVPVHSHVDEIHMLVALDQESLFGDAPERKHYPSHTGHVHQVARGGGVIYDADLKIDPAQFGRDDINLYPIPFFEVLEEALKEVGKGGQSRKYIVMRNTVALGASIGISGYDEELLYEAIRNEFKGRKAEAAELNVAAVRAAAAYARSHFATKPERRLLPVPVEQRKSRMLIKGFQAVGIAKLKAGLGMQTYYPISPATDESVYLGASQSRLSLQGLLVAGMVIGALGVLVDLTVSQASTVIALRRVNPSLRFGGLFRGALEVGHDHIAATVATLVFAYAGAALPVLLIFNVGSTSFTDAVNGEAVADQIIAALVGSIGLIASMPITTALAALLAPRMSDKQLASAEHAHAH